MYSSLVSHDASCSDSFTTTAVAVFAARCYAYAQPMPSRGVRLSRSWILSKRINIYLQNVFTTAGSHTIIVFPVLSSWQYSDRHLPPNGASNAGWVGKNRDSRRMSGYRIDDCCGANNNCDGRPCSLSHRPISESCLSQPTWTTTMKRKQNWI